MKGELMIRKAALACVLAVAAAAGAHAAENKASRVAEDAAQPAHRERRLPVLVDQLQRGTDDPLPGEREAPLGCC